VVQVYVGFVWGTQQMGLIAGRRLLALWLCMGALFLCDCGASGAGAHHDVISYGQFARLQIYRPSGAPRELALLLSGDGGWGPPLETLAARLAGRGVLVAGIDVRAWLEVLERSATSCAAPGAYLADLSRYLQKKYAVSAGPSLLIGHSAGASLVYVALAQARTHEFAGGLTLSFCADLDLTKPLCPAAPLRAAAHASGARLLPGGRLPAPWTDLHGIEDQVCPAAEGRAFAQAVPGVRFVPLAGVGHSYDDIDTWWAAFVQSYEELQGSAGSPAP